MLNKDFVIQSNTRRILVRSNIEYSRIEFGTVRGVVYFWGVFKMGGLSNNAISGGEESERKLTLETFRELVRKRKRNIEKSSRSRQRISMFKNGWKGSPHWCVVGSRGGLQPIGCLQAGRLRS